MTNLSNEEIVNEFRSDIEFQGGGELSSEIDDRKRLLGFIKALDIVGIQNSPDLGFKLSLLDTFWEELGVKAEEKVKGEVGEIMKQMDKPKRIYSRAIVRGSVPKARNISILYNLISKYNSILRKEAHRQLNIKNG